MADKQIYQLTETLSVSPDDWLAIDLDSSNLTRKARVGNVFSVSEGSSYSGGTADGVMFNDGNTFTTDGGFKFDSTTNTLTVGESGNNGVIELLRPSGGTTRGYLGALNSGLFVGADYSSSVAHMLFDYIGKSITIGNFSTSLGAALGVANTTDIVAHRIDLSNGQTADAFQINSYGNTGGDLFKIESNGDMYGKGRIEWQLTGQTGWNFYVDSSGSNTHIIGGGNTLDVYYGNIKHSGTSKFAYGSANKTVTIGSPSHDSASAILSLISTTKGYLPPRMTTTERDAIPSPATGLSIFNTTTAQPEYYSGTAWEGAAGGGVSIGDSVSFANANRILFSDQFSTLRDSDRLQYNHGSGLVPTGTNNSSIENVIIGHNAGSNNTAIDAVLLGYLAGSGINSGSSVAIGRESLRSAYGASDGVYVGKYTGYQSNGTRAIALGYNSFRLAVGNLCVAVGEHTLYGSNGDNNVAVGQNALNSSTGGFNTAIGARAMLSATSVNSTAVGYQAGQGNSGDYVLALGHNAGNSNTQANRFIIGQQNLPQFAGAAAAADPTTGLPAASANGVYLYWDTTDNTIKARP